MDRDTDNSIWQHAAIGGQQLPVHAITTLTLGDGTHYGHWPTAVEALIHDILARHRPVLHVQVGGASPYANNEGLQERLNTPYLATDDDEDLVVYAPTMLPVPRAGGTSQNFTAHGAPYYACNVPTLHNVRQRLAPHERALGPALVILDDIAAARPYRSFCCEGWRQLDCLPMSLDISPQVASGWLATDLAEFAEGRAAPTVVVWDEAPSFMRDVVRSVALLDIEVVHATDSATVTVTSRTRTSLLDAWGEPRTCLVQAWRPD